MRVCVCEREDVCNGWSGLDQIIAESILHVVGRAQYVEGVLQGVVGVDPVCIWREHLFARAD